MRLALPHENDIPRANHLIRTYFGGDQSKRQLVADQILPLDPTGGKYLEWLVREYVRGKYILPKDGERIKQLLVDFVRLRHHLEHGDILRYGPHELEEEIDEICNLFATGNSGKHFRGTKAMGERQAGERRWELRASVASLALIPRAIGLAATWQVLIAGRGREVMR